MSLLDSSLTGVLGARTAKALDGALGLVTVGDLVHHFPRRYVRFGELTPISDLTVGQHATIVAEVRSQRTLSTRTGKKLLKVTVVDGAGGSLELTFFAATPAALGKLTGMLKLGTRALFDGKLEIFNRTRQLTHPRFERLSGDVDADDAASRIRPIYPASAKVPTWTIATSVATVLPLLTEDDVPELLPADAWSDRAGPDPHGPVPQWPDPPLPDPQWPTALQALRTLHAPDDLDALGAARDRLRFDEALILQTALVRRRAAAVARPAVPRPVSTGGLLASFDAALPFTLTAGQQQVGEQIAADLARPHPMHRLLQGEVGSGKTLVALRAMLTVVDAGGQAALLAPTEVLATQHHRSITAMLGGLAEADLLPLTGSGPTAQEFATQVVLLTGSLPAAARRTALAAAADGRAGIVVGTHALIQDAVEFRDLGLVVVDEQHRFGVEQRDALRAKATLSPHLLVMTATPIPRTVAMTAFGDLETSTLTQVPSGRQPVASFVVPADKPAWMARTWAKVREEVDAGRQAFVVCPAIEPRAAEEDAEASWADTDENAPVPPITVAQTVAELSELDTLAGVRIGVLHGRLPTEEKDAVMRRFVARELDVLVATTVIEVGVDVPNASVMVVMDATRFGISQLHQLRGRIGRGAHPGTCLFVAAGHTPDASRQVLEQVAAIHDGFALSRLDLEVRREGDVLGAAQSGALSSLRLLRVTQDEDVITSARHLATDLLAADPDLSAHPDLARAIDRMLGPEREAWLERG